MKLLYPEFLILIPFLFLFMFVKNRKKISLSSKIILNQKKSNLKIYFLVISIILMIVSLSRPVNDKKEIEVKTSLPVVAVAIDSSYSMFAKDIYPNRFEFAKLKAKKLIDKLNAKIAVFVFSNNISLISPPTDDKETLKEMIGNIPISYLPTKGTSIQTLIDTVKDMKIDNLIILSDGGDEKSLDTENMNLYTLLTSSKKGSPIYSKNGDMIKDKNGNIVISKANEDILSFSKVGVFYSLTDSDINKLSSQNFSKNQNMKNKIFVYNELFYYPLILAILFFSISIFSFPKRSLALILLLFMPLDSKAGIFDFNTISEANNFYEKKEYKKAINEYSKLNSNEALYNKANSFYKLKEYDSAIKTYNEIKTDDKTFKSKILYNKANALYYQKKLDDAIKTLEEAQKLNPNDEDIKNNLEYMKKQQKDKNKNDNKSDKNKKDGKNSEENKKDNKPNDKKNSDKKSNQDKKSDNKPNDKKNSDKKSNQDKKSDNKPNDKKNSDKKSNQDKKSDDKSKKDSDKKDESNKESKDGKKQLDKQKDINIKSTNKNILKQIKTPTLLYPVGENKGDVQNEW